MTTTQQAPDPNALLMGGGVPSASFDAIGASVTGTITEPPISQQERDFTTKELKYWEDGNPMWQVVVTLQTDEFREDIEDDDGRRRLYLKNNSKKAVSDAVRKSGAKGLEVGGKLTLTYVGNGEVRQKGMQPPKQYQAEYIPAAQAALDDGRNADAPPATTNGQSMTLDQALAHCATVGITKDQMRAVLARSGFNGWNELLCTPLIKALVADKAKNNYANRNKPLDESQMDPNHPDFIPF